jgi:hypothetical protein
MLRKGLTIGMIGIVALFAVPIMPAVAEEPSVAPAATEFQALSRLPDGRRVELTVMTEQQLSAVEGQAFFNACFACLNLARVDQANVNAFSFATVQSNVALIHQRNQ